MPPEAANEASQSQDQDISLDDLHRAAEEARSFVENEPVAADKEEEIPREERSEEFPVEAKEEPEEPARTEREEEEPPEPRDNKERSQLGRKVAALEGTLKAYEQQIQQTNMLLNTLLQQNAPPAPVDQTVEGEDEAEYIPSTRKEFDALLEKRIKQIQEKETQEQTAQRTQYETGYLSTLTKLGAESDDSALHEEAFKLSTEAGAPYNVVRTGNPLIDAETNYHAALVHVLKQRLTRAKKDEAPKNPLKGDPPRAPLGAPSGMAAKVKEPPKIKLDDHARRAAMRMGLTDADVSDILGA